MFKLFVTLSVGLALAGNVGVVAANVDQKSPVPCKLGEWKPKGLCDPVTFKQVWTRDVITAPEVGACGSTEEERTCDPTDCQMSAWTSWTDCNAKGYKTRSRSPVQQAQFGGRECPPGFDKVKCECDKVKVEPRVMGKSDRIAIVGGGVSGLSAAETLVKHGFTNVVVYEAGSSIVPLQHAVKTEDYVYDMDIVYVPALSWQGVGLDARYNTILQEYEQELVLVSEYTNISRENWHLNTSVLPQVDGRDVPTLHSYTNTRLNPAEGRKWLYEVQQFFHDYASFFQSDEYNGIQSCLDQEIALKNETFNDWTRRLNYPVLRQSVIHTINLYGNFPVGESPACQVIMILANKMPSMLGPSLGLLGTQPDFGTWLGASPVGAVPPTMMNWMMSLSKNGMPSFMRRFKKGYAAFFSAIVLKNNINYRTNARVDKIVPLGNPSSGRGKIKIEFTSSTQHPEIVDHVFVAGRPDQIHSILPDDHPMKPLYSTVKAAAEQTTQDFGIYGSAVVSFEVSPNAGFIAQDLFVIDHQKHLVPTYSGVLSATVNLMRMVKMAPAKIMTVVFQTKTPAVDTDEEVDLLVKEMELYGFYNIQVLKMVHYRNTPTRVPVDAVMDGWYDKADAAQGHHGMYFVGETFSGHGVPTTFIHTRDWITRAFNLPVADDTAAEIL